MTDPESPQPNIEMLNAAVQQSDASSLKLTAETWRSAVLERLQELDWDAVIRDVSPFLVDHREIDLLNSDDVERILVSK